MDLIPRGYRMTQLTPVGSIIPTLETKPCLGVCGYLVLVPYICVKALRRINELEEQDFFFFFNTKTESTSPANISGKKPSKSDTSLQRLLKHNAAHTQHLAPAARKLEPPGAACCSQADAL